MKFKADFLKDNKPFYLGGKMVYKCQNVVDGRRCETVIKFVRITDYPLCNSCYEYLKNFKEKKPDPRFKIRL